MHEILFRGKSTDFGDWLSGYIRQYENGKVTICDVENKRLWFVDPSTVGEFTGLTDNNGKKIFEGDVVLYPWNDQDKPERFTIKFKDGQFVASPVKEAEDYWDFMVGGYSKEMEVIGNIHDNPELLENP